MVTKHHHQQLQNFVTKLILKALASNLGPQCVAHTLLTAGSSIDYKDDDDILYVRNEDRAISYFFWKMDYVLDRLLRDPYIAVG